MRCVTLMVNRSDRRFHTLSPTMAREAVRLIVERSARKSIKAWASSQAQQAGRIYDCNRVPHRVSNSTLDTGGVHICLVEGSEFELPVPVSKLSDDMGADKGYDQKEFVIGSQ